MAQGIGNRYSNCFRNAVFRYYPNGVADMNNYVTLWDIMELSDNTTMQTETINGMGDLALFISRGKQEHMGSLTVYGLTHQNMRRQAGLLPSQNFSSIRNPSQSLWICNRKVDPGEYTITEDATVVTLEGVVFNERETPRQASSSGVIPYNLRFRFTCPYIDEVANCGDDELDELLEGEAARERARQVAT